MNALFPAALLLDNATSGHDLERIGPVTLSATHWQLVFRAGSIAATIAVAFVLMRLVPVLERFVIRFATKASTPSQATASVIESRQRFETLTRVTSSLALATIWTLTIITILGDLGISVGPLMATAGVAGVAVGFGAQSIVKDFFAGFFILLENQFDVGDTITIGSITGTVERMTMRITVLRDINGTAHFVPNSSIGVVSNRTHGWSRAILDVPFAGTVDEAEARAVLESAASRATEKLSNEGLLIDPVAIDGPLEFAPKGVTWRVSAKCRGDRVAEARRVLISALTHSLQERTFATDEEGALVRSVVWKSSAGGSNAT